MDYNILLSSAMIIFLLKIYRELGELRTDINSIRENCKLREH